MIKVQRISVSGVFGSRYFLLSRVRNYLKRWERKIVGGEVWDNQNQKQCLLEMAGLLDSRIHSSYSCQTRPSHGQASEQSSTKLSSTPQELRKADKF